MTEFGKFLVATIVSFCLMIGALGSEHPTFLIALVLLVWVLFVWSISSGPSKRNRERDEQTWPFNSFK